ncbi:cysteine desulfurase family protein [Tenacibaculum sp. 190524A05c]|uniref:cysteine desulfurase family protein n=1 Tax=Tenacibaculum platacis TaxID=3137852 RepID=UPI0032B2B7DA
MKQVYFDHAATTYMYDEVVDVMMDAMKENYGNPSSIHQFGRKAKVSVEKARKNIATLLGVSSNEIVFTSSGTEGNNLILNNAVYNLGVKRIITSKIEHHAVLNVVEKLSVENEVVVDYVALDESGMIDLKDLERLLSENDEVTLVSLMMVNNEIGNILPYAKVAGLCENYNALFHTDAVQAIGQFSIDLKDSSIDFLVASAHKFHGPKGVGFVYVKKNHVVKPMILGGGQERGVRSSTENVSGILGMEKALALSLGKIEERTNHIIEVKKYFYEKLNSLSSKIKINGSLPDSEFSIPKILNVRFPLQDKMLLFNLDLRGVAVSSGSACQSGGSKISHVLREILLEEELNKTSIRFSFSERSSKAEVDCVIDVVYSLVFKN